MWDNDGKSVAVFPFDDTKDGIRAYTVAELGEMLPEYYMSMKDSTGGFVCEHFDTYACPKYRYLQQKNEAQARAAMLIFLLENAILSPAKTPES